ncbi:MAG: C4-dicarboxylate ABC transporter, partial [Burkholderiales bacterium]
MRKNSLKSKSRLLGEPGASRRRFLTGTITAAAGAVIAGFPMIAVAQTPIRLRFEGAWSARDIFHEYALDYAKKVNDMSSGRLRIEVLPAGAVVKPFDLLDAVHKGTLDGCHGVPAYWYGKNSACSLFGTGPALGMDANNFLAWMEYGGGRELYNELLTKMLNLDVVGFLYGPMPTQPLGWFRWPLGSAAQLKGLRYRATGLTVELLAELGAKA